jgi:anti-anti-sigma regulatory factor
MKIPSATLIRLPEHFNRAEARALAAGLDHHLRTDQPCLIMDFSRVKQIDSYALDMILLYMVKVAREDGTVQLGEISPEAAIMLELTRMDRIFDMFPRISKDALMLYGVPAQDAEQAEQQQVDTGEFEPLAA